ncbi:MAG: DUF3106 domain-containing protein [Proteobacteria bacterium]|nr:DUF3106 domain-containing protein [Pseudomonadota bacterium]
MLASLLALGLGALAPAQAQQPAAKPANGAATVAPAATAPKAPTSTRPLWTELTPAQQQSLAPLAAHWNGLHPAQKRKWIALSRNFDKMTPDDQEVLHSRMTEWAGLSAQERTSARLNFAEVKRLAPEDERKAKWEAYQALSEEDKRKLAEQASRRPPSAAAPVRPVPAQKFAPVPSAAINNQYPPRIQLGPPAAPATPATPAPAAPVPAAAALVPAAPAVSAAAAPSGAAPAPAASVAPVVPATPAPAPTMIRQQEAP